MKTKGALLRGHNQPWSIEEIELDPPRYGEVLVRMETAGLCHIDHHLASGDITSNGFPILGGHEGAGVVTGLGPGVTDLAVGDHVALSFIPSCGTCPSCRSGASDLCDVRPRLLNGVSVSDGTFRAHTGEEDVYPMSLVGAFAPYAVVHHTSAVKIDPAIPFEVACLVGCAVTTGYGASVHSAQVRPGDDVAIVGVGGVGSAALQGAIIAGARRVFVVDPSEWKREQARKFGATHAYADAESALEHIAEVTDGRMCKKVIVTVGRCDGRDLESWMQLTAKAGTCVLASIASAGAVDTTVDLASITLSQKTLLGCLFGGGNPRLDIPEILALYKLGELPLDELVTREYRLDQINDGYRDMLDGVNIRGVIRFTNDDR
ncbi:NDMA-dependent alcohol dehydrogenase [Rhodococcus artemisiae]|uniref:alcohol dehydrogenase n=1 Tax=Rhodococcus artemisiae TaxID=714159 RepID=A0ABU7LAD5_9NOCA|nr:NDMA-dependent alcohol dehydrogenase [Rhodococcus artemisiae]MEE2058508.1 NDMA-dependent alcohol dehydrogenase [Rhodococcus artemisiae]